MAEEWLPVSGYEGLYEVSNIGHVRNMKTGHILKPINNGNGYLTVSLCKEGKPQKLFIHRLVATAFVENPNNYNIVNHLDESRNNNSAENLEWTTNERNLRYGTATKRMAEKLRGRIGKNSSHHRDIVCVDTGEIFHGSGEINRKYGISTKNISSCCKHKRKVAGGMRWMYREEYENEFIRN